MEQDVSSLENIRNMPISKDIISSSDPEMISHGVSKSPPSPANEGGYNQQQEDLPQALSSRQDRYTRRSSASAQSRLRSESFRKTSAVSPLSPSSTSSALPPLDPSGDAMDDIYRRQAVRVEDLEKENLRLSDELKDAKLKAQRREEVLEELREASSDNSTAKGQSDQINHVQDENSRLQTEIAAMRRQLQQRGHSQSISRQPRPEKESENSPSSFEAMKKELEGKTLTITNMEIEISRLRNELSSKTSNCETHSNEIARLSQDLRSARTRLGDLENELAEARRVLNRASEKATKDGAEQTSRDTKVRALERDLAEASAARDEVVKKAENLDKKIQTMNKLHKETEARSASKISNTEAQGREINLLKARLAAIDSDRPKTRQKSGAHNQNGPSGVDSDALDELEDEERLRLENRVRELENEVFELKRGIWQDKRKEMQPPLESSEGGDDASFRLDHGNFDEVDLSGNDPSTGLKKQATNQHSSLSTVLNSGLEAFHSLGHTNRPRQDSLAQGIDDDGIFNEQAYAIAQREEEARKMVRHVREIKQKLRDRRGWRLDLVESRRNAAGMQESDFGEIFDV